MWLRDDRELDLSLVNRDHDVLTSSTFALSCYLTFETINIDLFIDEFYRR